MKVLCITSDGARLRVDVGSDQAVLRHSEPVFVPDPVGRWKSAIAPAIRISRLGTAIKEASARAYYDSIAPVHLLTPADDSVADGLPPYILDRALSPGEWIAPLTGDGTYTVTLARGPIGSEPTDRETHTFSHAELGIDGIIASLSRHLTFRTGDILVMLDHAVELGAPQLDTEITAAMNGSILLNIRIK